MFVILPCLGTSPSCCSAGESLRHSLLVIKPAEDTPLSTLYFCYLAQEAGVPEGVINVVAGFGETAGASLTAHPGIQCMSFAGSPEVGRKIATACVLSYLRRGYQEGASFLLPGGEAQVPACGGFYVKPGLLTGSNKSEDEVVALVNRSSLA